MIEARAPRWRMRLVAPRRQPHTVVPAARQASKCVTEIGPPNELGETVE